MFIKHLLTIATIFGAASSACFDNGDKEIGGSCYKLVPQKLTYADAQNWCHYQNPVTSSYLAYVPNQFTANFLASYARSAFGTDDGNFWIGLSRKTSSSPWMWDNGLSLGFSNFGGQLGNNFAAESIVNAKWNTFGSADTNFFVCSYDPQAPPTFAPQSTNIPMSTIPVSTPEAPTTTDYCTTSSSRAYFYAYSTEVDPNTFYQIFQDAKRNLNPVAFYANVRLDLKQPESIIYHSDFSSWNSSVYSHWPNPSLGFSDSDTGSDVLNVIEQFLDNTQVSLCGAFIHISLKRYPNEKDIENLVARIRKNHAMVTVVIPTNSSGGMCPQTMYQLATRTNGLGFFAYDDDGYCYANSQISAVDTWPNLVYSTNVNVSQSGSVTLPDMILPFPSYYYFSVTVQDSGIFSTFRSMNLTVISSIDSYSLTNVNTRLYTGTNFLVNYYFFKGSNYNVTLDYSYSDSKQQTLQIRIFSAVPIDYWIPYAN